MANVSVSGANFDRAWALHRKLGQSELLADPQLRHPDDSVEGQLWERKQGHEDTKVRCPNTSGWLVGWLVGWLRKHHEARGLKMPCTRLSPD
jgi:hypothetical protein